MERKKLLKYLKGNRDYTFKIRNFIIPKNIITVKDKPIDLEDNRKKNLKQGSKWSPNFKELLDTEYNYVDYIREFIFLIRDRMLWERICWEHNIVKNINTNYFIVDYFLHEYNFVVEIDSRLHNVDYDKARDEYLMIEYGIKTLRFYEFGKISYDNFVGLFKFNLSLFSRCSLFSNGIDYSKDIIQAYLDQNKRVLPLITRLEDFILSQRSKEIFIKKLRLSEKNLDIANLLLLKYSIKYLKELVNYFYTIYKISVVLET